MLSHLALSFRSLERSATFYRQAFGFQSSPVPYRGSGRRLSRLMEVPDCELRGLFLRQGEFFLELLEYQPADQKKPSERGDDEIGVAHLSFVVDDLKVAGEAVDAAGGATHWETTVDLAFGEGDPVAIAFCTDPDGNRIELVQHRDAPGRDQHARFLGADQLGWPTPAQQLTSVAEEAAISAEVRP